MKKTISALLSVLMIFSMLVLPVSAVGAEENEDWISGYIRVDDAGDEVNYGGEIFNGFHSSETSPYKGMSYDVKTNTLTLDNVKGEKIRLFCDQMLDLKIKVVGSCTLGMAYFFDTTPSFDGTGTLSFKPENDEESICFEYNSTDFSANAMTVSNTVTLKILGNSSQRYIGRCSVTTYDENGINPDGLISYSGKVSEEPKWETDEVTGGPIEEYEMYLGNSNYDPREMLVKTRFPASKLLRKVGSDEANNVYIPSMFNYTESNNCIAQVLEHDGIWYEDNDGTRLYWKEGYQSEYTFEEYGEDGVKYLPQGLVDSEGYATVNAVFFANYSYIFKKGSDKYIITSGDPHNSRVGAIDPPEVETKNQIHIYKLCNQEGFYWLEYVESAYVSFENITHVDQYMERTDEKAKEMGYERSKKVTDYPYYFTYYLTNKSLSFTPTSSTNVSFSKCTVSGIKSKQYTGKAVTQSITVKYGSKVLKNGTDYTVSYKNNVKVGTATVTITGKAGRYTGSVTKTFKITKANNPLKLEAKAKNVSASKLKKGKQTVKNAVVVKKNQGAVTFARVKKGSSAKLTISKKGVITVAKGKYKKGTTLKLNVKVTAKGNANYKSGSKTVAVKIKIK